MLSRRNGFGGASKYAREFPLDSSKLRDAGLHYWYCSAAT